MTDGLFTEQTEQTESGFLVLDCQRLFPIEAAIAHSDLTQVLHDVFLGNRKAV
jgi:hypothetical protein